MTEIAKLIANLKHDAELFADASGDSMYDHYYWKAARALELLAAAPTLEQLHWFVRDHGPGIAEPIRRFHAARLAEVEEALRG